MTWQGSWGLRLQEAVTGSRFLPGRLSFPGSRLWAAPPSLSIGISDTGFRGAAPPRGPEDREDKRGRLR